MWLRSARLPLGEASSAAEASLSDASTYSQLPSALYRVRGRPCDGAAAILKVSPRPGSYRSQCESTPGERLSPMGNPPSAAQASPWVVFS